MKRIAMLTAGLSMMLTVVLAAPATSDAQDSDQIFGTVVTCIASSTVQGDSQAETMGVGNVYMGTDGTRHLITTGGPLCSFNCEDGFDINCDGVRGDYCPAGLDLSRVDDVGKCLAFMTDPPAGDAATADAKVANTSVPELAFTGTETTALAVLGAGMLSAGSLVMGLRRKLQD